jgi:pilus assembly protein Flp/PilA
MKMLSSLKTKLTSFTTDESGATIVEYGLLAALIAVFLIAAVRFLSNTISTTFGTIGTAISSVN